MYQYPGPAAPVGAGRGMDLDAVAARLREAPDYSVYKERPVGGGKMAMYVAGDKVFDSANDIFGPHRWSCMVRKLDLDYCGKDEQNKWSVVCHAIVRVNLMDDLGRVLTYHEDVGSGESMRQPALDAALDKARKSAVTDARKRAMRLFGRALGIGLAGEDGQLEAREKKKLGRQNEAAARMGSASVPPAVGRAPASAAPPGASSVGYQQTPYGNGQMPCAAAAVPGSAPSGAGAVRAQTAYDAYDDPGFAAAFAVAERADVSADGRVRYTASTLMSTHTTTTYRQPAEVTGAMPAAPIPPSSATAAHAAPTVASAASMHAGPAPAAAMSGSAASIPARPSLAGVSSGGMTTAPVTTTSAALSSPAAAPAATAATLAPPQSAFPQQAAASAARPSAVAPAPFRRAADAAGFDDDDMGLMSTQQLLGDAPPAAETEETRKRKRMAGDNVGASVAGAAQQFGMPQPPVAVSSRPMIYDTIDSMSPSEQPPVRAIAATPYTRPTMPSATLPASTIVHAMMSPSAAPPAGGARPGSSGVGARLGPMTMHHHQTTITTGPPLQPVHNGANGMHAGSTAPVACAPLPAANGAAMPSLMQKSQ